MLHLACAPADIRAADLGVRWNAPMPEILAEMLIDDPATHSSLHLVVIGGSHVVTVEAPSGRFREEISCNAREGGEWPLPGAVDKQGYRLETRTRTLSPAAFAAEAADIADGGGLIASFPGEGEYHLTALRGACVDGVWHWWTHHLYPGENTIVSTRSQYHP